MHVCNMYIICIYIIYIIKYNIYIYICVTWLWAFWAALCSAELLAVARVSVSHGSCDSGLSETGPNPAGQARQLVQVQRTPNCCLCSKLRICTVSKKLLGGCWAYLILGGSILFPLPLESELPLGLENDCPPSETPLQGFLGSMFTKGESMALVDG